MPSSPVEREALATEIRDLETARDSVSADVSALEWHVGEQRSALLGSIARLQAVLDDPAAFRLDPAPHVSGTTLADVSSATVDDDGATDVDVVVVDAVPEALVVTDADAGDDTDGTEAEPINADVDVADVDAGSEESADGGLAEASDPPVLFDGEQDGEATRAHQTIAAGDESPLGPPDDDADAAMKAFFEAEFDDDPGRGGR